MTAGGLFGHWQQSWVIFLRKSRTGLAESLIMTSLLADCDLYSPKAYIKFSTFMPSSRAHAVHTACVSLPVLQSPPSAVHSAAPSLFSLFPSLLFSFPLIFRSPLLYFHVTLISLSACPAVVRVRACVHCVRRLLRPRDLIAWSGSTVVSESVDAFLVTSVYVAVELHEMSHAIHKLCHANAHSHACPTAAAGVATCSLLSVLT